jgi:hypothetical protein
LLEAAVVASFLPRELAPGTPHDKGREEAEKALLQFAETIHAPGGTRWSLTREARRDVLNAVLSARP